MNLPAIEELIIMMCPPDEEVIANVKSMMEIIKKDPQKSLVRFIGSVPALNLDKSSWMYGVMNGVALSAASVSPDMMKNFKR